MFKHFLTSANESNAFILACDETREALLVDVGEFEPAIAACIQTNRLTLASIFITHDHYDHTGGLRGEICPGVEVIATPGHTPDALSLAFPGMVFTGDALFAGSVGGTASPALARQQLDAIRNHIFSLPEDTEIHTGHGPSSTVAIESRYNPFFV